MTLELVEVETCSTCGEKFIAKEMIDVTLDGWLSTLCKECFEAAEIIPEEHEEVKIDKRWEE